MQHLVNADQLLFRCNAARGVPVIAPGTGSAVTGTRTATGRRLVAVEPATGRSRRIGYAGIVQRLHPAITLVESARFGLEQHRHDSLDAQHRNRFGKMLGAAVQIFFRHSRMAFVNKILQLLNGVPADDIERYQAHNQQDRINGFANANEMGCRPGRGNAAHDCQRLRREHFLENGCGFGGHQFQCAAGRLLPASCRSTIRRSETARSTAGRWPPAVCWRH